jgi:uncharacterized alkaline shock family protein YloU
MKSNNPSGVAGSINLSDDVVATIAGLAARDIEGIHSVGKSRWVPFTSSPTRGVDAEVGNLEAAIDIDIEIEYGCNLQEVASMLRTRIAEEVEKMATRDVVEINVNVVDVRLPEPEPRPKEEERRVR